MVLDRWETFGFQERGAAVLVDDQHVSTEACLVCDTSVRSPYYNFSRDVPLCQRLGVAAAMVSLLHPTRSKNWQISMPCMVLSEKTGGFEKYGVGVRWKMKMHQKA